MIALREPRVVTALLVAALSLFAVWRAAPLLRYGVSETLLDEPAMEAAMRPLTTDRSVGFLARRKLLTLSEPGDGTQHIDEIGQLLALAPLSSATWLELARARFSAGAGAEDIFGALALSRLTGPNEAYVMAARASFGLPLWAMAPAEAKSGLVRDLVGGWIETSETQRTLLRIVLQEARPETRDELRAALVAAGKDGATVSSRLGLSPEPDRAP